MTQTHGSLFSHGPGAGGLVADANATNNAKIAAKTTNSFILLSNYYLLNESSNNNETGVEAGGLFILFTFREGDNVCLTQS